MRKGVAVTIPLPAAWQKRARFAIVHAMSLAAATLTGTRGWAANHWNRLVRVRSDNERLRQEVAMLEEELRLKDARLGRIPGHERPHFPPIERLGILQLRALRGWSARQVADRFFLSPATVSAWMRRIDERGGDALIRTPAPVNKYPEFVAYIVQQFKVLCPTLGYTKIADFLARGGLNLATSTVRRMIRRPIAPEPERTKSRAPKFGLIARRPNHVWHCDLTTVPTSRGLWTPVLPGFMAMRWPFCWWLGVVADQYSCRITGLALFRTKPTAQQVIDVIVRAIEQTGARPKYLLTDKGDQFRADRYKAWCRKSGIRRRHGSLGQFGSIPFIERVIETIKNECTRRISIPYRDAAARKELALFRTWYNSVRPHERLSGATPDEAYDGVRLDWGNRRLEPRRCSSRLALRVNFLEGRKHLPVVALKRVA